MVRYPSLKLGKQSNKVVGRTRKHKQGEKAIARRVEKQAKQDAMEDGSAAPPPPVRTQEEKAVDKAARKKLNKPRVQWKSQIGFTNTTARNGPRATRG